MTITFYNTLEEMFEDMDKQRRIADKSVNPIQALIQPGQYYVNYQPDIDLFVFGEILDYKTLGATEHEQKQINELYSQTHMRYFRPSKAYSTICPNGEIGDVHLSTILAVIDKKFFGSL